MTTSTSHGLGDIVVQLTAKRPELVGQQRRRSAETDFRSERQQAVDIRARNARVQDVTDDRDGKTFDLRFVLVDGQQIEKSLRRMLVAAVAGVDDRTVDDVCQQSRGPGSLVAHHDRIR